MGRISFSFSISFTDDDRAVTAWMALMVLVELMTLVDREWVI